MLSFLTNAEKILGDYKLIFSGFVGISGWLFAFLREHRRSKIVLSARSQGKDVFLFNESPFSIEVVQGNLAIRDISRPAALAKEHTFLVSPCGIIKPDQEVKLFEFDHNVTKAVEEISAPMVASTERFMQAMTIPRMAAIRINVFVRKKQGRKLHRVSIGRMILGVPQAGWELQYLPHHFSDKRTIRGKFRRATGSVKSFMKSPHAWQSQRRGMKILQRRLTIKSVLAAAQDGALPAEQVQAHLKKSTGMNEKELVIEMQNIIEESQLQSIPASDSGEPKPNREYSSSFGKQN